MPEEKLKKVLIVDDEKEICELIEFHIHQKSDYKTFTAFNMKTALKVIGDEKVDVVISDVRMPEGDGMELLDKIERLPRPRPHVIIISGLHDEKEEKISGEDKTVSDDLIRHITDEMTSDEVQEKGGYSYLSKPLNYDTMMKTLKDIFEKRKEP